jgi:broad specificity phosphatase PhoE
MVVMASAGGNTVPAIDRLVQGDETRFGRSSIGSMSREWPHDTYRTRRRAYVDGADHPDWEARTDVVARFEAGITEHLTAAAGRPVIVASHGMAITLWLTTTVGLHDPGAFWSDLRFPDAHIIDLTAATTTRLVETAQTTHRGVL